MKNITIELIKNYRYQLNDINRQLLNIQEPEEGWDEYFTDEIPEHYFYHLLNESYHQILSLANTLKLYNTEISLTIKLMSFISWLNITKIDNFMI